MSVYGRPLALAMGSVDIVTGRLDGARSLSCCAVEAPGFSRGEDVHVSPWAVVALRNKVDNVGGSMLKLRTFPIVRKSDRFILSMSWGAK